MSSQMTNNKEASLLNTLFKEQFRLKLGVVYLFASGFNIIALIICYFVYKTSTLDRAISIYLLLIILYYKFGFKFTKDGGFYNMFIFRLLSKFQQRAYKIYRDNLKENSAKKIGGKNEKNNIN